MSVSIEQIKPGAVFRFKTAPRRVTSLSKPLGTGFKRLSPELWGAARLYRAESHTSDGLCAVAPEPTFDGETK